MYESQLLEYLQKELSVPFKGWDFSHLEGRWSSEELSWDYKNIILKYLQKDMKLLDVGTGGGEFLLSLNHPYENTAVTENYPPNIELCKTRLVPLGVTLDTVSEDDKMPFPDNSFDIIINRHESYSVNEIKRILKPNGIFITQQVGKHNNYDLAKFLNPKYKTLYPDAYLDKQKELLQKNNFQIIFSKEEFPKLKFFDIGAFAYFANIIKWEFQGFNIEKMLDKLYFLHQRILNDGYIISNEHRFILVTKKQD